MTHQYRFPTEDRFLIYTKCFDEKLQHLATLGDTLRYDLLDFGSRAVITCDFSIPRIEALLKQAVTINNFRPV